ncbi:MAG: sugar ABC transporter permease [Actinomycetota bacterium]
MISLALAAAIFVGSNRLIDQIQSKYAAAIAGLGGLVGLLVGAVLQHNDILKIGGDPPLYVFGNGWLTIVLGGAVFAGLGYLVGQRTEPSLERKTVLERNWRVLPFVVPAVFFVGMGLVIPSLRTMLLSLNDGRRGDGSWSLEQYQAIFEDDANLNFDNFGGIFTSRLTIVGLFAVLLAASGAWASTRRLQRGPGRSRTAVDSVVTVERVALGLLAAVGVLVAVGLVEAVVRDPNRSAIFDNVLTPLVSSPITLAVVVLLIAGGAALWLSSRSETGERDQLDWGSPRASTTLVIAAILILFAVFSTLQSVIWNNLWWVVVVTGLSVTLGLLLAVLADRARGEVVARTLIFLPMAISMVGAAVIWDFMYELQPTGDQTGLVNAILQGMGWEARGFFINGSMIPWNNFWIMLILVWIQTGFAMVILSSAIKGVPTELIEAARVDGATEVDVFWRVIIPQIRTTIVVVTTTLIIVVMKVFDLVKATTGGANRTNVLANEMFDQLRDRNFGLSSAFAVLIFALTLPVMVSNVRRNLKEVSS